MSNKNLVVMPPEYAAIEERKVQVLAVQDTPPHGDTRHFNKDEVTITIRGYLGRYSSSITVEVEGGGFKGEAQDKVEITRRSKDQQALNFALQSGLIRKACENFLVVVNKNGWDATISVPSKIDVMWNHDNERLY